MDCWLNVPNSKITSLVFVAAYLRPCVSIEWCFGTNGWLWLPCIGVKRAAWVSHEGLECLLSSVWNAVFVLHFTDTPILSSPSTLMDCWLNTLSYPTVCLAQKTRVCFLLHLISDPA